MSERVSQGVFFVYGLCDPSSGHLRYIGKTANGMKRIRLHFSPSKLKKDGFTRKANWIRSLLKLGLKPQVVIIEEFSSEKPLNESEIFHIAYFKSIGCELTNLTIGGDGSKGYVPPPELRAYLSVCGKRQMENPKALRAFRLASEEWWRDPEHKALRSSWAGKQLSEEHKRRIGDSNRGRPISEEHRRKISIARTGKKLSPEHIAKIKASRKGYVPSLETRARMSKAQERRYELCRNV